jgi:hypothetical protein
VVSVTLRPRIAPVPIGKEAGWATELIWTQRLEEKSFASVGDRTLVDSLLSDTTITEILQLEIPT